MQAFGAFFFIKKINTRKGAYFFGGDKGTCAFSGAPRSAIINCRLCRQVLCGLFFGVAKRFALAKRLPPSSPFVKSEYQKKQGLPNGIPCFLVETKGLEPLTSRM